MSAFMFERDNAPSPNGPIISATTASVLMWLGIVLASSFVSLRTLYQYRCNRRFYINDYLILFAMLCHTLTGITYQIAIPPMFQLELVGAGIIEMPADFVKNANFFLRLQFALDLLLWTTLWSVKFSLLSFFWRLFDSIETHLKIFWWVMCCLTASTYATSVVLQHFACDPISNFFIIGACESKRDIYMSNLVFQFSSGVDIGGDVLIMLIPFPLLQKLQVSKQQKRLLFAIFCIPIIPIIFAILKLVATNPTNTNVDPVRFQLYSMLENTTAIIAACLPAIRLFFDKHVPHNLGEYERYAESRQETSRNDKGPIPLYKLVRAENGRIIRVRSSQTQDEGTASGPEWEVRIDREFKIEHS